MEDALALLSIVQNKDAYKGLNPCFNGRCTRTIHAKLISDTDITGLNPCFNGRCTRTQAYR